MKRPNYIPKDYKRIKVVGSLSELFNERFGGPDEVNCILQPRRLSEDFNALAQWLGQTEYITQFVSEFGKAMPSFSEAQLFHLKKEMPPDAASAADLILQDMDTASNRYMRSVLRYVRPGKSYDSVFALHHDEVQSTNSMLGRFLCCYNGPVTEGVRNEDAFPMLDNETGRPTGEYMLGRHAKTFSFRPGDVWRQLSTPHLKNVAPPYIHRSPWLNPGDSPRLLLIAACP